MIVHVLLYSILCYRLDYFKCLAHVTETYGGTPFCSCSCSRKALSAPASKRLLLSLSSPPLFMMNCLAKRPRARSSSRSLSESVAEEVEAEVEEMEAEADEGIVELERAMMDRAAEQTVEGANTATWKGSGRRGKRNNDRPTNIGIAWGTLTLGGYASVS